MAGSISATTALGIAGLVAAGAGTGASIYEADKSRDASAASATAAQQAASQQQAQQAALDKSRALATAGPNAQAQTGGSLTGSGQQSFADILAGYAGSGGGTPNTTAATVGATNAAPSTPAATPNFQDLLKQLGGGQGSTFSGGSGTPPQPNANFSLSPSY